MIVWRQQLANGESQRTSADTAFPSFKVQVTDPHGSKTVKTLTQLGITEINWMEYSTKVMRLDSLATRRVIPDIS